VLAEYGLPEHAPVAALRAITGIAAALARDDAERGAR